MKVAVTYENGQIFQHFGHTQQFKVYEIQDGKIVSSAVVDAAGGGHCALAGFLGGNEIEALICGGIGGGARKALAEAGIKLFGGCSGSADAAAQALAEGKLAYDPNVLCRHHDEHHGHDCHGHGHDHGCHGHGHHDHDCHGHGEGHHCHH